jgi:hypothetical protein
MRRTAQKLSSQGAHFEYIFTLYIPFGDLQLDLTLQEITPFQFDSRLTIESYEFVLGTMEVNGVVVVVVFVVAAAVAAPLCKLTS